MAEQPEQCSACRADEKMPTDVGAGSLHEPSEANPALPAPMQDAASDLSTEPGSGESDSDQVPSPVDAAGPEVQLPVPFTPEETFIIFDWDDTLLASTWVQHQKLRLDETSTPNEEQHAQLYELAQCAARTLQVAKQRGTVIIVTNGEQGWVELSCWKFMPSLLPVLEGIRIISARSTYEKLVPSPFDWKLRAFEHQVKNFYQDSGVERRRNVISLGDSMHEHMALMAVTQGMVNCRAKSLKFMSFPQLSHLVEQHSLVSGRLDDIVDHDESLSLEVFAA